MANVVWTKGWSSADNGTIVTGVDLQNLQNDLTTVLNGGLTDSNISSSADIQEDKILFDTSSGHDHDGTSAKTVALGSLSNVALDSVADGQVLTYVSADVAWKNQTSPTPTGAVFGWSTATAPSGFLLCDGSEVSRTTYAALFAVIGETYGAGDSASTFNLPSTKGKTIVGLDPDDADFDTIAETGGAKTDNITHDHILESNGTIAGTEPQFPISMSSTTSKVSLYNLSVGSGTRNQVSNTTDEDSQDISIVQPYLILNYIIKT